MSAHERSWPSICDTVLRQNTQRDVEHNRQAGRKASLPELLCNSPLLRRCVGRGSPAVQNSKRLAFSASLQLHCFTTLYLPSRSPLSLSPSQVLLREFHPRPRSGAASLLFLSRHWLAVLCVRELRSSLSHHLAFHTIIAAVLSR